jgi:tRNA(Ile)-lysidine synthase
MAAADAGLPWYGLPAFERAGTAHPMVAAATNDPIRPDELDGLFAPLLEAHAGEAVGLAVSGGSDSTALMVLFADWLRRRSCNLAQHTVLTVDHRLRPQSSAEAETVAHLAAKLGFRHATLVWEGRKPQTGLQAAAREARYRLMADHTRANGIAALLTAHTRDDQAETLLMRLARGSGLDGLAGMAPSTRLGALRVLRPFLDIPKARLRATLEARAIPWIEDPSNQSPAFERTRLRVGGETLAGLGLTGEMLALTARRLQRARTAIEAMTDSYCADPGVVHTDRCGFFRIDRARLAQAPEEVLLRVLARCIAAAGGSDEPVPLGKLEPIVDRLFRSAATAAGSWTLARALVSEAPEAIQIEREPGRQPPPRLTLAGGASSLWDGRFAVAVAASFEGTLEVGALGADGLADLRRLGRPTKSARSLHLLPSFWRGSALLAVPALDFWANPGLEGLISAEFVGLRYNTGAPGGTQSGQFGAIR